MKKTVTTAIIFRCDRRGQAVICSNMKQHEAPDQTGLYKCRLAAQSPTKEGTPSTEIREQQRTDFQLFQVPVEASDQLMSG